MGESKNLIPRVLRLTLVHNTGTAFGLLKGHTDIFTLISIAVIFSITLYLSSRRRYLSSSISISLALILGGAAGNLIDRIRFGYVIDFLDIIVWPVFNIADMAITAAAAILIADVLITRRRA